MLAAAVAGRARHADVQGAIAYIAAPAPEVATLHAEGIAVVAEASEVRAAVAVALARALEAAGPEYVRIGTAGEQDDYQR